MTVTLPAAFETFVQQKIASGLYQDADDVVVESLALLQQQDHWKTQVSAKIDAGLDDLDAGRTLTTAESEAEMAAFKARWRARA